MLRKSTYIKTIPFNIAKVWQVVTDTQETTWRSDLTKTEKITENSFVEHFKKGGTTVFNITHFKINQHYQFKMKNQFFEGIWIGRFEEISKNDTKLTFYEELHIKNPLVWGVSFIKMNLKEMQKQYVIDLEKCLSE